MSYDLTAVGVRAHAAGGIVPPVLIMTCIYARRSVFLHPARKI